MTAKAAAITFAFGGSGRTSESATKPAARKRVITTNLRWHAAGVQQAGRARTSGERSRHPLPLLLASRSASANLDTGCVLASQPYVRSALRPPASSHCGHADADSAFRAIRR